ncbi:predicted protein [Naegleria gruberi]|uniref:tRNA (cytosine(38)-C(5))-methyltransferase n=1 Tax=Naegleria gruberi TaxID=5762 RepID=D2V3B7_NAEGR|nr:uncharacterized protein NAEGRDRAFT_63302 [Naegleria gruberi]EFC48610.1 predicted protein [Naegleria gruberi]|eukprot:XP_002681354.1 predicted protein [Naegleria gruberi strain NEG-M]
MASHDEEVYIAEFYSGIGGTRMSLEMIQAFFEAQVNGKKIKFNWIEAFDINENANTLYNNLFNHKPCAKDIVHIPIGDFQNHYFKLFKNSSLEQAKKKLKTEQTRKLMWTMSPPCQPFTLNGNRKDSEDDRSKSFLFLMADLFPQVLPDYIFVENVKNFEISKTRQHLVNQLENFGYKYEEYLICPTQLGLPNQRVRYYLIGKRVANITPPLEKTEELREIPLHLITDPPKTILRDQEPLRPKIDFESSYGKEKILQLGAKLIDLYDLNSILLTPGEEKKYQTDMIYLNEKNITKIKGYRYDLIFKDPYGKKNLTPIKSECSCITKSYGQVQFLRGTGPIVLILDENQMLDIDSNETIYKKIDFENPVETMMPLGKLRFLHPIEVSRLMTFVPWIMNNTGKLTVKQLYKLMGNSVNPITLANIIYLLFSSDSFLA